MIDWVVRKKYFQKANHAIWFLTTISFAGLVVFYYFLPRQKWVWLVPIFIFHISPIVKSVKVIKNREQSDLYSKDCIWFNALMILSYLIIGAVINK